MSVSTGHPCPQSILFASYISSMHRRQTCLNKAARQPLTRMSACSPNVRRASDWLNPCSCNFHPAHTDHRYGATVIRILIDQTLPWWIACDLQYERLYFIGETKPEGLSPHKFHAAVSNPLSLWKRALFYRQFRKYGPVGIFIFEATYRALFWMIISRVKHNSKRLATYREYGVGIWTSLQ